MFRTYLPGCDELANQLVDRFPAIPRLQFYDHFFPCSRMTASIASASAAFSRSFAEIGLVQKLLAMLASVWEVFLELTLRNEKKHDELHRLVVESVEVHPCGKRPSAPTTSKIRSVEA